MQLKTGDWLFLNPPFAAKAPKQQNPAKQHFTRDKNLKSTILRKRRGLHAGGHQAKLDPPEFNAQNDHRRAEPRKIRQPKNKTEPAAIQRETCQPRAFRSKARNFAFLAAKATAAEGEKKQLWNSAKALN